MPVAAVLDRFTAPTRRWFTGAFAAPTAAQLGAWDAIANGDNTLVIAPTGSGKTLSAFLWALDRLAADPERASGLTRVVYISPLKALAVDVERNLRAPLTGITRAAQELGEPAPEITVGLRSGDTPAAARRSLITSPPDILITTPESLYLMLTSQARESLRGVQAVIVDEVHAVAGTKRGTHLALSLERLDELLDAPAQRIGLSATVRPPAVVAGFLAGHRPCTVVAPPASKTFDLRVDVPVPDMAHIPAPASLDRTEPDSGAVELDDAFSPTAGSLWPYVESAIVDLIAANRTTIVFANSRRLAERLTARLNEISEARAAATPPRVVAANTTVAGGAPATLMASGATAGAPAVAARAHHGSVSKEQRAEIEDDLKTGRLRCVVATSSLELGIDMGAVDLVVQVESPPSVASGLQRIGRAGHQVGEISQGVLFPKHRTDLIHCTVAVERMVNGAIEELTVPKNPLDVLAQQTIAAAAIDELDVERWYEVIRRSAPYRELGRSLYEATLDLISGRYPSDEFAELRPRVTWDRERNVLTGRRGAQRLAVTSGGTIPDRGQFAVFMVSSAGTERGSRVGELDEEMVYESRVGDVFALGATSWRIEDITHDRVLVSPAFGQPGRLPFWIGDSVGRPAELGAAIGHFTASIADPTELDRQADTLHLSGFARDNLAALIAEQRAATGHLPSDRTLVVERFRDELGDWRVILHSPYGLRVHAPWASAISLRLKETLGLDGAVTASDDGIIVRLPDTDDQPPGASVFIIDPDEIEHRATVALGDSSMFAARFRECAARALLLPRRDPGRRAPLWQQRQRSAQLLSVASQFPEFPIILEAVRECLQDIYDLPALTALLTRISTRKVRVVETETQTPSPFAASLLFGYVGAFMYNDDAPLAERRAAALSLDTALLAQLLGRVDLRELLDPAVIAELVARLQRLAESRKARDADDVVDLLRWLGPLTTHEVAQRYRSEGEDDAGAAQVLAALHRDGAIISVTHRGQPLWAAVEDTARLRDGLGIPAPLGIPAAFLTPVADPVGDLVHRYARTHGPFTIGDAAAGLGLGAAVVGDTLARLAAAGKVIEGDFLPVSEIADGPADPASSHEPVTQWCHSEVLGQIRRGSLAASRADIAPVDAATAARFLNAWQHVSPAEQLSGVDGVALVIDQLAGYPLPASAWESMVLPARVSDYTPAMLDELLASGDVLWSGAGRIGGADGWVRLCPADLAEVLLPAPDEIDLTDAHRRVLARLSGAGGLRFGQLVVDASEPDPTQPEPTPAEIQDALWDLLWSGAVSNDSFAPLRTLVAPRRSGPQRATPSHRSRGYAARLRPARHSTRHLLPSPSSPAAPPIVGGRWFLLPDHSADQTVCTHVTCEQLLARYGVVTRGSVTAEAITGGFSRIYKALNVFEDSGQVRRGYYIDGLGGAQFATPSTVDDLRRHALGTDSPRRAPEAVVLAATDPANPYGAALGWPERPDARHRPGRKPGAVVVLVDGECVLYIERGGKTMLTFSTTAAHLHAAAEALVGAVRRGQISRLAIDQIDGQSALQSTLAAVLTDVGFSTTPRGLRMRFDHRARG